MSGFAGWTTHPLFYSSVFVAEVMGKSNTTQIKDMFPNEGNDKTPAYAVFENGRFSKMAMINYMNDPSGANDYTATIYVGGSGWNEANAAPASVKVKYLLAPSVSEKNDVTWAGQVSVLLVLLGDACADHRDRCARRRSAGSSRPTGGGRARR